MAYKTFPEMRDDADGRTIVFQTKELDICRGQFIEINESSWEEIIYLVSSLTIGFNGPRITIAPPPGAGKIHFAV